MPLSDNRAVDVGDFRVVLEILANKQSQTAAKIGKPVRMVKSA